MRTSDEALQRMERLVERMAAIDAYSRNGAGELRDEARAILALKVDPDLEIAQQICDRAGVWSTAVRGAVLAGIKYGRAMGAFDAPQPIVMTMPDEISPALAKRIDEYLTRTGRAGK